MSRKRKQCERRARVWTGAQFNFEAGPDWVGDVIRQMDIKPDSQVSISGWDERGEWYIDEFGEMARGMAPLDESFRKASVDNKGP